MSLLRTTIECAIAEHEQGRKNAVDDRLSIASIEAAKLEERLAAATERAEKAERERDGALKEAKRNAFDASVGRELEAAICMETHFTGEEPYVGTAGLILAIKECAEAYRERDALKKLVEEAVPVFNKMLTDHFDPVTGYICSRGLMAENEWRAAVAVLEKMRGHSGL